MTVEFVMRSGMARREWYGWLRWLEALGSTGAYGRSRRGWRRGRSRSTSLQMRNLVLQSEPWEAAAIRKRKRTASKLWAPGTVGRAHGREVARRLQQKRQGKDGLIRWMTLSIFVCSVCGCHLRPPSVVPNATSAFTEASQVRPCDNPPCGDVELEASTVYRFW